MTIITKGNSSQSTCANHADIQGALINCRLAVNKTQDIQFELVNNNLDLCALIETWMKEGDTITSTRLCPHGYKSLSIPRHDKVGGDIAIVYKSKFKISIAVGQLYKTMESTCFSVNTGNRIVNLIAIYRPLDSNVLEFCNEFTNLPEYNINSSGELSLLEVINIAVNKLFDAEPAPFLDILDSFNWSTRWTYLHTGCPILLTLSSMVQSQTSFPKQRSTGSSLATILFSSTLPHSTVLPPQKCGHTKSTKTSVPMPLWRISENLFSTNPLDHFLMTR